MEIARNNVGNELKMRARIYSRHGVFIFTNRRNEMNIDERERGGERE